MDRITRQNFNKKIEELDSTVNQPDLADIIKHSTREEQDAGSSRLLTEQSPS